MYSVFPDEGPQPDIEPLAAPISRLESGGPLLEPNVGGGSGIGPNGGTKCGEEGESCTDSKQCCSYVCHWTGRR